MDLEQFLLLLFDKKVDRYPVIRESLLKCFSANQVLDILAAARYRCTQNELKRYIYHTCLDKGVKVRSLGDFGNRTWSYALMDHTLHSEIEIEYCILPRYEIWQREVQTNLRPLISVFEISSSNSEFSFSFTLSAYTRRELNNVNAGYIRINCLIYEKLYPDKPLESIFTSSDTDTYPTECSIRLPTMPNTINGIEDLSIAIKAFTKPLSMSVRECRKWFESQKI